MISASQRRLPSSRLYLHNLHPREVVKNKLVISLLLRVLFRPALSVERRQQMQIPQELIDRIIDCLSKDHPTLEACSLVATTWVERSRHHLFNSISLTSEENAKRWCSAIGPGPNGPSALVRELSLRQHLGHRWLSTKFLDTIPDLLPSFQRAENLSIAWLYLSDFEPGSPGRHFAHHHWPSLRSLHLSYLSADFSALITYLQLFPNLEDLLIHTPDLCDDNPPPRISRTAPLHHGTLTLLSFDSISSPFVSHIAGLDLQFSSISAYHCDFLSGFPLDNLLEASSSSLRKLELEYITFCVYLYSIHCVTPIDPTSQLSAPTCPS